MDERLTPHAEKTTARLAPRARVIALYLPQFHPVAENDEWWGPGFTEWTNTARARPLFGGHHQPNIPGDLGYYDLRLPETRLAQAELARRHGIEAFCYYHYWFAGRRILERPFNEVLASGQPDFGFCLCWANQTWAGIAHGLRNRVLIEQTYPGDDDDRRHFDALLPALLDPRYLRVDGKPVIVVYRPQDLPDPRRTTGLWRRLASDAGLGGLHFIGQAATPQFDPQPLGFDASMIVHLPSPRPTWLPWHRPLGKIANKLLDVIGRPTILHYDQVARDMAAEPVDSIRSYPCVIPNWDNTPRSGAGGLVMHGSTPEGFRKPLRRALQQLDRRPPDDRLLFIKSWNEWAEGNYLEPDRQWGHGYLQVLRDELTAPAAPQP